MRKPAAGSASLVRSYLTLRLSIGVIGIGLPFALGLSGAIQGFPLQTSVSQYYHAGGADAYFLRDILVGSLAALGIFLWSYCGHDRRDTIASNVAAFAALGIALFPTAPHQDVYALERVMGVVHIAASATFFVTLAYIALFLFRLSDKLVPTPRKLLRNRIYAICGYAILLAIILIALVGLLPDDSPIHTYRPVFWLEALAIVAFGVSWLTKSEAILEDSVAERLVPESSSRIPPRIPQTAG